MRGRRAALALALSAALVACGGDGTFDAEEIVSELNANGASLALGEELFSASDEVEIYAVEVESAPQGETHAGGGSLRITEDSATGLAEYERCEAAASLLCFRAANAVLILEDELAPADRVAVEQAVAGLASD